ncbi:hypothetical protein [Paeniglutamicibacter antarcticus]|uniref:Cell division protein FtsL n=1 Tax=Paeniglutamicibacter antarcticus TaxID=494023 RepID=A0ABP9TNW7_9MICC
MSDRIPNRVHTRVTQRTAIQGANALSAAPAPISASRPEESTVRSRTTLSVVPGLEARRKVPFLVSIFIMIIASVIAVLLINVSIANGQYKAVELRGQERALSQENEALRQEALYLGAPQVIAKKAAELGMVKPGAPAAIDLESGKISGTPTAAEKPSKENEAKSGTLKAPASPERPVAAKEPSKGVEKATGQKAVAPKAEKVPDPKSQVAQKPATTDGSRPSFAKTELNGGTIPAPSLKAPGQ